MREAQALSSACPARAARVGAAGALAQAALAKSGGRTRPVPGFAATGFRLAAGELIWVGRAAPLHPRVVLVDIGDAGAADERLDIDTAYIHVPRSLPRLGEATADAAKSACRAVLRLIAECEPGGFATLLAGRRPAFPQSHRADAALALAAASAANDVSSFVAAASLLLGAGSGLTPSGDDYVGAALFARRLAGMDERWLGAAGDIVALAPSRTHAISAALLGDLAAGSSYAALHDLAETIAARGEDRQSIDAQLQALAGIGHSSGWDMLAGFVAGLAGTLDLRRN
jgi:Protein of unknown function (DUF2877)